MPSALLIGSTNVVELTGLRDEVTDTYPTDATVVLDLLTTRADAVPGATGIPLAHVGGTSGAGSIYRGFVPHTVALVPGPYVERITATDAGGNVRVFRQLVPARRG
jgi:hypothetical protein